MLVGVLQAAVSSLLTHDACAMGMHEQGRRTAMGLSC